ncbi:RICIN domain-containing protein [Spirillospora sp. CA-294931]|uniref:RICIN domain-containing protein n=1 Tax=Spirillospora sp. CA-294931 TaxID=3240042 RepID=UPI003D8A10ED
MQPSSFHGRRAIVVLAVVVALAVVVGLTQGEGFTVRSASEQAAEKGATKPGGTAASAGDAESRGTAAPDRAAAEEESRAPRPVPKRTPVTPPGFACDRVDAPNKNWVVPVYVYEGRADRYRQRVGAVRQALWDADQAHDADARRTGRSRRLRIAQDAQCRPLVAKLQVRKTDDWKQVLLASAKRGEQGVALGRLLTTAGARTKLVFFVDSTTLRGGCGLAVLPWCQGGAGLARELDLPAPYFINDQRAGPVNVRLVSVHTGQCLAGGARSKKVVQARCGTGDRQVWQRAIDPEGFFTYKNLAGGLCMEMRAASVVVAECVPRRPGQQWTSSGGQGRDALAYQLVTRTGGAKAAKVAVVPADPTARRGDGQAALFRMDFAIHSGTPGPEVPA